MVTLATTHGIANNKWVMRARPNPSARMRLFCFPYAGGGASVYRAWANTLPPELEVCAVQLPGRENRLVEPLFERAAPLVDTLAEVLEPYLDMPFAFFGHSMGALIAFELARELRRARGQTPVHLFAAGRPAPQVIKRDAPVYQMSRDKFLDQLRFLNGTPSAILQNPELMELVLPILRADFALNETYMYYQEEPFGCPLSAFGGRDDPKVDPNELKLWERQTTATFRLRMLPGNHFFINSEQATLLRAIADDLRPALA